MTGAELEAALRELIWPKANLARLTGTDRRTVYRWCDGTSEVPLYAETIVRQQLQIRRLLARPTLPADPA